MSIMTSLGLLEVSLALVVICFIIFLGKNKRWVSKKLRVYPNSNFHEYFTKVLLKSQGNFLFQGPWFSNLKMLYTADPENVHYILNSNFNNFDKGPDFKSIFDALGDGIFNSDSDQWRDQRKTATMLVNHRNFQKFMVRTTTNKIHNGLFSVLNDASEKGSILDLQDVFYRFTFDCTLNLVVGIDPGCLSTNFPDIPIAVAMDDEQQATFYRNILPKFVWKLQRFLGVGQEKKLSRAKKTLDLLLRMYIREKKEKMANENQLEATDLLASYIHLGFEDVGYLKDMVLNMLIAGRDTVSLALTMLFWNLSQHPSVEKKIREEISSFDQETDNFINKLVYLHAAICESLRLYPVLPINRKHAIKPDILPSGHHVDPSIPIMISAYAMGRMPSIWGEDCLEFRPERWITDKGGFKYVPAHKFLAFSAGPRICLGKDMTFTQMKIVIVNIVQKFNIQVVEGQDMKYGHGISLSLNNGLKIKVAKR